jgi:hypothetical protein
MSDTSSGTTPSARRWLAAIITAPAVVTALIVTTVDAGRLIRPTAPLFVIPQATTLGEAILRDDAIQTYRFIRSGRDPNAAISVRHEILTGDRDIEVAPVLWAVAVRADNALGTLLGHGATLDAVRTRQARCLAESLGLDQTVSLIARHGAHQAGTIEPCVRQPDGSAVLLNPIFSASEASLDASAPGRR